MTTSRSSAATAHLVAKLLAVLPMPTANVPNFIAKIDRVVRGLSLEADLLSLKQRHPEDALAAPPAVVARRTAVVSRPSLARASVYKSDDLISGQMASHTASLNRPQLSSEFDASALPPVEIIPARRRGRPPGSGRKAIVAEPIADIEDEPTAPVQPRLLRRADVAVETSQENVPFSLQSSPDDTIRGVVKWFDGRTGKGALRLTGIGDVALEQRILDQSHIKRLYRDQEIEAHVEQSGSKVRLLSLSIPNRSESPLLQILGNAGETMRTVKRQPRPVVVEIKRDTVKRRRSRADADHAFGGADAMALLPIR